MRYDRSALITIVMFLCCYATRSAAAGGAGGWHPRQDRRDRQVLSLEDFSAADIQALEATRAPEATKAFDDEVP